MLNDFNTTKAIYDFLNNDDILRNSFKTSIHTHDPEKNSVMPYIVIELKNSNAMHWSATYQRIVCDFTITVFSNYHGIKETQAIVTRLHELFDKYPLKVEYNLGNIYPQSESSGEDQDQDQTNNERNHSIRSGVNIISTKFKKLKQSQMAEMDIKVMLTLTPNNQPLDSTGVNNEEGENSNSNDHNDYEDNTIFIDHHIA